MLWILLPVVFCLPCKGVKQPPLPLPFTGNVVLCGGDALEFVCRPRPNNVTVSLSMIRSEQTNPRYRKDRTVDGALSLRNTSRIIITSKNLTVPAGGAGNNEEEEELLTFSYLLGPLRPSDSGVYECRAEPIAPSDLRVEKSNMTLLVKADCKIPDWLWRLLLVTCTAVFLLLLCGSFVYYRQPIKQPLHRTILITHDVEKQSFDSRLSPLSSVFVPVGSNNNSGKTTSSSSHPSSHSTDHSEQPTSTLGSVCHPSVQFRSANTSSFSSGGETAPTVRRYQQSIAGLRRRLRQVGSIVASKNAAGRLLSEANLRFSALYTLPSDDSHDLPREHLAIQSCIGAGAFGVVYSAWAYHLPNRSPARLPVAVKTLRGNFTESDVVDLIREMDVMKQLHKHPHVIELLGVCTQGGAPLLVMEYAPYGNLRSFLRARKPKLQQSPMVVAHLLEFGRQVADGMKYLALRSVIHRDLAARNILVGEKHLLKIADFGLTRAVENYYRKQSDGRLPIKWLSPESIFDRIYTSKSDIWSFGVLLWEIFTLGLSPFHGFEPAEVPRLLRTGYRNPRPRLAGDKIYGMMQACWEFDPQKRPSFDHLFNQLLQWGEDECQYQGIVRCSDGAALSTPLSFEIFEEPQLSAEGSVSRGRILQQKCSNSSVIGSGRYAQVGGDTDVVF